MTDIAALKATLRNGKATIDFTKVNGHKRTMVATLDPGLIPETKDSGGPRDPNLLIVFDVEAHGWRTIKIDSIHNWVEGEVKIEPVPVTPPTIGWTPNTPTPV
jgi:hypothetical protein